MATSASAVAVVLAMPLVIAASIACATATTAVAAATPVAAAQGTQPSTAMMPVVGRVVDPEGQPVRGARVAIMVERPGMTTDCFYGSRSDGRDCLKILSGEGVIRASAVSELDGRFRLLVPSGLRSPDYLRVDGEDSRGVRLSNGWPISPNRALPTADLGEIALHRWRELVVIVQGGGRPLPDAEVSFLRTAPVRTDVTGTARYGFFASTEHDSWTVNLTARAPGFAVLAWFDAIPSGTTTEVVTLVPETLLTGRVLDAAGAPVPNATITVGTLFARRPRPA